MINKITRRMSVVSRLTTALNSLFWLLIYTTLGYLKWLTPRFLLPKKDISAEVVLITGAGMCRLMCHTKSQTSNVNIESQFLVHSLI